MSVCLALHHISVRLHIAFLQQPFLAVLNHCVSYVSTGLIDTTAACTKTLLIVFTATALIVQTIFDMDKFI